MDNKKNAKRQKDFQCQLAQMNITKNFIIYIFIYALARVP